MSTTKEDLKTYVPIVDVAPSRFAKWRSLYGNPAWNASVLLFLVALAAYFQTWMDLWPYLHDASNHTLLLIAVALWLIWTKRSALAAVDVAPKAAVLPAVLMFSAAWMLAAGANSLTAYTILWPILTFTMVWAGAGWRPALALAVPLGALYFAMPFWDTFFEPPLQVVASVLVGFLTSLIGMQAVVEGTRILLPDQTIFIALPCSGAAFFEVSLAMSLLVGEMRGDRWPTRLLIAGIAAVNAIAFNALRILLIAVAYAHPVLKHWMEEMGHAAFGWWVLTVGLVAFYFILRWVPMRAPVGKPEQAQKPTTALSAAPWLRGVAAAAGAALLLPVSSWLVHLAQDRPVAFAASTTLPGLTGPIAPDSRWQPHFEGPAWAHRAAYIWPDGRVIETYQNEYDQQSAGKELISRQSPLFDPATFPGRTSQVVQVNRPGKPPLEVTRSELVDRAGRKWIALHTYTIGEDIVASALRVRLLTALHSMYGRPVAGVLAVVMPCGSDCASASNSLDTAMIAAYDASRPARSQP